MRVLAIQNFGDTGLGQLGTALEGAGVEIDLRRLDLGEPLPPDSEGYAGLVILGGAQNAVDDAGSPWFPALLELARAFEAQARSVLGICLGAQLLARAFGAENRLGAAKEFGWREVVLTEEGRRDPLTGALPDPSFRSFQWHDDTFTLPPGAVRLAFNDAADVQAFRIGRAAYGVQFHFEADRAAVRHWSETLASYLAEQQPGWEERRGREASSLGAEADAAGAALGRAWIATLEAGAVAFPTRSGTE